MKALSRPREITDRFIETVTGRLSDDLQVRRNLPIWGRLHVDRQLPFLCVYRRPQGRIDAGTERLVTSEASYLLASGARRLQPALTRLVDVVARTLRPCFGGFLILEVWSGHTEPETPPAVAPPAPGFRIVAPKTDGLGKLLDSFEQALTQVKLRKKMGRAEVVTAAKVCPKRFAPVLSPALAREIGCTVLGLEVDPIYRDPTTHELFPRLLREFRPELSRALKRTFFEFTQTQTTHRPAHFHVLGRRALVKAVWTSDRELADVSSSFDFLLQVTPVNSQQAWLEFRRNRFERAPVFHYRPLAADPIELKRRLFLPPVERIEDPALSLLFRQKQDELDRQITMLVDLNTRRFVHGSVQLYGEVEGKLLRLAKRILKRLPSRTRDDSRGGFVDAATFARRADAELAHYREALPSMTSRVEVREDIVRGLMVSRGSLLVGKGAKIPVSRVEALLQHEVGTHVVTYFNGRAQPFRQLYSGLAGYEALQEGIAVLAEYLVGGLSRPRLRLLAARVVAVQHMLDGASFVETFRELDQTYGFEQRTAFTITNRIYRGGGLTKDAVYLRGLCEVLDYLGKGGKLDPLFVGKIGIEHIPIIRELQWRKVLSPVPLRPRYLDALGAAERLERIRAGVTVLDLVEKKRPSGDGSGR